MEIKSRQSPSVAPNNTQGVAKESSTTSTSKSITHGIGGVRDGFESKSNASVLELNTSNQSQFLTDQAVKNAARELAEAAVREHPSIADNKDVRVGLATAAHVVAEIPVVGPIITSIILSLIAAIPIIVGYIQSQGKEDPAAKEKDGGSLGPEQDHPLMDSHRDPKAFVNEAK